MASSLGCFLFTPVKVKGVENIILVNSDSIVQNHGGSLINSEILS